MELARERLKPMLGGMNLRSDRLKSVPTRLILYPLRMQPGGRGAELGTLRMDLWGCRLMLRSDRMKSGVRELTNIRLNQGSDSLKPMQGLATV